MHVLPCTLNVNVYRERGQGPERVSRAVKEAPGPCKSLPGRSMRAPGLFMNLSWRAYQALLVTVFFYLFVSICCEDINVNSWQYTYAHTYLFTYLYTYIQQEDMKPFMAAIGPLFFLSLSKNMCYLMMQVVTHYEMYHCRKHENINTQSCHASSWRHDDMSHCVTNLSVFPRLVDCIVTFWWWKLTRFKKRT
jgi:hypothetical protein